ncbi:MAG: NAD(P)-binding domain-containing protein, partial [Pseudomonadales bacterium]
MAVSESYSVESAKSSLAQDLLKKIKQSSANVGVIGLGYVGLPLVELFCRQEFSVVGFDIDDAKVDRLNAGESYIGHIPSETVAGLVSDHQFEATNNFDRLKEVDIIVCCVPTPLTRHREPDLTAIIATTEAILPRLQPGQLVILESSTFPGTTDEIVRPILEQNGLEAGRDFFLAYSPEREDPGNKTH